MSSSSSSLEDDHVYIIILRILPSPPRYRYCTKLLTLTFFVRVRHLFSGELSHDIVTHSIQKLLIEVVVGAVRYAARCQRVLNGDLVYFNVKNEAGQDRLLPDTRAGLNQGNVFEDLHLRSEGFQK